MLERHFRSFKVIDRIKAQWLGPQIVRYAQELDELHMSSSTIQAHVRTLGKFNDFVIARGVTRLEELPDHVDAFVEHWLAEHGCRYKNVQVRAVITSRRCVPVERMLCLSLHSYMRPSNQRSLPFITAAPGFFQFLLDEKGLRQTSLHGYSYTLRAFEDYLEKNGITFPALTPAHITAFIAERAKVLHKSGMCHTASALRTFLRYLHREDILTADLGRSVPRSRTYQQSAIPRAIEWSDVERLLTSIDRRSVVGKRDYAILILLASYGLRAREIAALRIDDCDWAHAQICIPMRKGGHATRYPLSETVAEALIAYLQVRRNEGSGRELFLTVKSPYHPIGHWTVSHQVGVHMRNIGIPVVRAGSHTLRHTCVQRLIEADVPFKIIGDYVGHRSPSATLVYGKVAIHKLRQTVIAQGEDVL